MVLINAEIGKVESSKPHVRLRRHWPGTALVEVNTGRTRRIVPRSIYPPLVQQVRIAKGWSISAERGEHTTFWVHPTVLRSQMMNRVINIWADVI